MSHPPTDEARHITGDYYWVDEYRPLWWGVAGVFCLVLPPVGAGMLAWMAIECLTARNAET